MSPKLSIVRSDDACEGAGKGAQVIQLPVTSKLHAIEGGRTVDTTKGDHEHTAIVNKPHTPYVRPNIGVGHHNAQRHWEVQDKTRERVTGVMLGGVILNHLKGDEVLAATTTFRRADGVNVTIQLTHNAYEQLIGTRLRVPTDIGEYDY